MEKENVHKIKSKIDWQVAVFIYAIVLFVLSIPIIESYKAQPTYWAWIIIVLSAILLLSFVHGTVYSIRGHFFHYRSGIIFGKIDIHQIKKVTINKTLWVGLRPATALNGVIIRYGFASEIYVSPINNEAFVQRLVEINPSIEIIRHNPTH